MSKLTVKFHHCNVEQVFNAPFEDGDPMDIQKKVTKALKDSNAITTCLICNSDVKIHSIEVEV